MPEFNKREIDITKKFPDALKAGGSGGKKENQEGQIISKEIFEKLKKKSGYGDSTGKNFLGYLPKNLLVPSFKKEVNKQQMTEAEMIEGHEDKLFKKEEAFGLAAQLSEKGENGIIFFEEGVERFRIRVSDGGQRVNVDDFLAGLRWGAGDTSFFRD